jgi:hypothetical protein
VIGNQIVGNLPSLPGVSEVMAKTPSADESGQSIPYPPPLVLKVGERDCTKLATMDVPLLEPMFMVPV